MSISVIDLSCMWMHGAWCECEYAGGERYLASHGRWRPGTKLSMEASKERVLLG